MLAALVLSSVVSLASGARGGAVANAVRDVAGTSARPILKAFKGAQDGVAYASGLVVDYDAAWDENRAYRHTFAELTRHVVGRREAIVQNERLRELLAFQRAEPRLKLLPAEIISRSLEGTLTIDCGSRHGVRSSMCVMTPDGIIGMVTQTGPLSANVATLKSANSRIDAMVSRTRVRGMVRGKANDLTRLCSMEYIDQKDDVREGDEIVASPDSVFPSGFPLGTVKAVHEGKGLLKSADVEPHADPFRADEVFVLINADTPWEEMAGPATEGPVAVASLPQPESIQERYAP